MGSHVQIQKHLYQNTSQNQIIQSLKKFKIINYNYNHCAILIISKRMSNFLESMFLASKSKMPINLGIGLSFTLLGAALGYIKAKRQADIDNQDYSQAYLKQYISEDQVNYNIDKSNKPAVLYYYQSGNNKHFNVRHGFIKSSHLAHANADFYLINLKKKFQKAIPQLQHQFPNNDFLMEIRFPKQNCQIVYTNGQQIQKNTYRRQFFSHQYLRSQGVQNFLQQNGIIAPKDPMQDFIILTKNCLFKSINSQPTKPTNLPQDKQ